MTWASMNDECQIDETRRKKYGDAIENQTLTFDIFHSANREKGRGQTIGLEQLFFNGRFHKCEAFTADI